MPLHFLIPTWLKIHLTALLGREILTQSTSGERHFSLKMWNCSEVRFLHHASASTKSLNEIALVNRRRAATVTTGCLGQSVIQSDRLSVCRYCWQGRRPPSVEPTPRARWIDAMRSSMYDLRTIRIGRAGGVANMLM